MPLNTGDRSEIKLMISEAIKEYDKGQEQRHKENLSRFDKLQEIIIQVKNIRGLIAWGFPLLISLLMLLTELYKSKVI